MQTEKIGIASEVGLGVIKVLLKWAPFRMKQFVEELDSYYLILEDGAEPVIQKDFFEIGCKKYVKLGPGRRKRFKKLLKKYK
jgi:hypothetical protein